MHITVHRAVTGDLLKQAFRIRTEVFVKEQKVPAEIEIDEYEKEASHVLVCVDGKPAGTGRVRQVGDYAKLERICVLSEYRKLNLGAAIVKELEAIASEWGLSKTKLNAQTQAQRFYEKQGYVPAGEPVFMEEHIPHIAMVKRLP
jgi:Predicted acyltransferase